MVKIMQVRKYHEDIAAKKFLDALDRWRRIGGSQPLSSMFFFSRTDWQGFETTHRKNGYVAFNDKKAVFGMTKTAALNAFRR